MHFLVIHTHTAYGSARLQDDLRHTGAAQYHESEQEPLNRTYPSHHTHTSKLPLLPSRIPVSSKRKETNPDFHNFSRQPDLGKMLPPLAGAKQDSKSHGPHPLKRRHTQYSEMTAPVGSSKSRDHSAKYKLRLAEKDQKILETHESIQV